MYIDREKLRDALYAEGAITLQGVAILNRFPGEESLAKVVRCKSCIHATRSEKNNAYYCKRRCAMHKVRERDFCSYGKRKENTNV